MPPLAFPMATLMFFQFVFAAITVIILAGSLLGRMNFKAWMIFCPVWMTLVYTVGAFSIWGGGWLAGMGAADFSGGYVIHLAAGTSGFVAAAVIGPRLQHDRDHFPPNSLLMTLAGAGILWLGWNGFNGGDPYFANADAGAAVLNTNTATAVALLVWTIIDTIAYGKPSVARRDQRHDRRPRRDHPGAGYVNGWGAIIIGVVAGIIPWLGMNSCRRPLPDAGRRHAERVLDPRRRRPDRRSAGRHPRQSRTCWNISAPTRRRRASASPACSTATPAQLHAAALRRRVHHRLQRDRDLHHPQGDLDHRAPADGRRDVAKSATTRFTARPPTRSAWRASSRLRLMARVSR